MHAVHQQTGKHFIRLSRIFFHSYHWPAGQVNAPQLLRRSRPRPLAMSTNGCDTTTSPSTNATQVNESRNLSIVSTPTNELKQVNSIQTLNHNDLYEAAIRDLNSMQSNTRVIALAKYKKPETILPLFERQLNLADIQVEDLNRLNIIHVSGTKGKGSTCAFLENILINSKAATKLKVGCYNSPHLISVTERIKINSKPIDKILFSKHFRHVFDKLKHETQRAGITMPSYFSFLTILAFHIFLEERIDCAIIEVGMGGEYDPTNIVDRPIACAITTLDLDHTSILGKTIERIAWTKAGIIKPRVPIFTVEHEHEQALKMIEKRAMKRDAPLHICKPLKQLDNIKLGIQGSAQYVNASLACHVAQYFIEQSNNRADKIEILKTTAENLPQYFLDSLETCQLAGRCQIIKCPGVTFFLDGAHTRKSMDNCINWFATASQRVNVTAKKYLLVNIIGERDKAEVLKPLAKFHPFEGVIFSTNKISSDNDDSSITTSETFVKLQDQLHEKGLENAKMNAKIWKDLVKEEEEEEKGEPQDKDNNIVVHSSTLDSIRFLQNNCSSMDECNNDETHVLVTGSLHFVGAMLETIELLFGEKNK